MGFLRVLALVLSLSTLFAENIKVYRDEYLIKSNVLGASLTQSLDTAGGQIIAKLENGISLVRPKVSAASKIEQDKVIDYDPNNDYCQHLLKTGVVKLCSPNFQVKASLTSNDPLKSQLWGLGEKGIQAEYAWNTTTGNSSVVVAVIDSGVDYNHQDLAANMWSNPFEIANNGIDDDRNGYIDDVHGINVLKNNGDPMDDYFHGTHCAGTIAAVGNNGVGIVGVSWNAKIMALKTLDFEGYGSTSDAVIAIDYIIAMKQKGINVKIASNSWGSPGNSDILDDAIRRADANGILIVAAAGNDWGVDNDIIPTYPANADSDNVISVAAVDNDKNIASFSNIGSTTVDIAAPGVGILSTVPGNGYASMNGTSMATPHVSGALALLAGLQPELSPRELIKRLYESAVPVPTLTNITKTGRFANVHRLITNQIIPINNVENHFYNISEIPYSPDTSADSQEPIIYSDEAFFETVNLPFNFPYGTYVTKNIVISPNGVIYLKSEPEKWDNKNATLAPVFSIAAFHTDLNPLSGGVSVKVSSDRVTVYWKATHYRNPTLGFVEVRTTLYANGIIRNYIKTPDTNSVYTLGTIGITFADSTSAQSLRATHNLFAVQFTPKATDPLVPTNSNVDISGYKLSVSKVKGFRNYKEKINLAVSGNGTGLVRIQAKFDGLNCSSSKLVGFSNGLRIGSGITSTIKKFKYASISVDRIDSVVKVGSGKGVAKKVFLNSACKQFYAGLK